MQAVTSCGNFAATEALRRAKTGVLRDVTFETKPRIALGQLRAALQSGIAAATVLTDAGYGVDTDFRDAVTALGLPYAMGIQSSTSLCHPGWSRCHRDVGAGAAVQLR